MRKARSYNRLPNQSMAALGRVTAQKQDCLNRGLRAVPQRPVNGALGFCRRLRFSCSLARRRLVRIKRYLPSPQVPPDASNDAEFYSPYFIGSRAFDVPETRQHGSRDRLQVNRCHGQLSSTTSAAALDGSPASPRRQSSSGLRERKLS